MVKELVAQVVAVLVGVILLLLLLYSWNERGKEVNALETKLSAANLTIKEKQDEQKREQDASAERDERLAKQDETLTGMLQALKRLQRDNAEIRKVLLTIVPDESLRGLRSFSPSN